MSYDNTKDLQIAISVGVNAAATLAAGTADPGGYFQEILPAVVGATLDVQKAFGNDLTRVLDQQALENQAVAQVQAAFPGTTLLTGTAGTAQVSSYVQVPQATFTPQVVQAPPAPAPIPGATTGDPQLEQLWQQFFQAWNAGQVARDFGSARKGQWFDNRPGKSSSSQPDFKIKGDKGERTPGVYVGGRGNPAWVAGALQQAGL